MDKEDRNKLINTEQLIGRALDKGVDLGSNPHQTINKYIDIGVIPKLINGLHPVTAVDRLIVIDQLLKDGKTLDEIKEIISKERKAFLEQAGDLTHLVNLYKKASFKGLLMLGSLAILMIFSYSLITAQPPTSFAAAIAREAAKPVGRTLAVIIKQAKDEGDPSTDPLGLTNISKVIQVNERQEIVIEKNIISPSQEIAATNFNADKVDNADAGTESGDVLLLDDLGNIDILGDVIATSFTGSGEGLTNLPASSVLGVLTNANIPTGVSANKILGSLINADIGWTSVTGKPTLLTSIDGVSNNLGNIDLVAGSGITITPNNTNNTITFSASGGGGDADTIDSLDSSQFLRSDISDSFTSGTLTIAGGTTLSVLGTFSCTNCVGDTAVVPGLTLDATASINAAAVDSGTLGNAGVTLALGSFGSITGSLADGNVADTITASNYLPLAGGTMAGNIDLNNNLVTNIGAAGTDFTAGGGLNIAADLDVAGHMALGANASVASAAALTIDESFTGSGIFDSAIVFGRYTGTDTFISLDGLQAVASWQGAGGSSASNVRAIWLRPIQNSSTAITNLVGADIFVSNDSGAGSGTISNAYGINLTSGFGGVVSLTTSYGIRIQNYGVAGATNTYGLYIDDQTGSTNNYELFVNGTAPVFALENSASDSTLNLTNPGSGLANLSVEGHSSFGSGAGAPQSDRVLWIDDTTSTDDIFRGITVTATSTYNDIGSPTVMGIRSLASYDGADTGALVRGIEAVGLFESTSGTPSVSELIGLQAYSSTIGATVGSVTDAFAINVDPIQIGSIDPTNSYGIRVENQGNAGTTDTYGIYIDDQTGSTNNYEVFIKGTAPIFALENSASNSTLTLTNPGAGNANLDIEGTCTSETADCAVDVAEIYNSSEPVEPGEVLVIDLKASKKVKKSASTYQETIIGIVSTNPAIVFEEGDIVLGADSGDNKDPNRPFVALAGRVPVKVSGEGGIISPGDPLTSSSNPGVAMKATKSGPIVGKALESLICDKDSPCQGTIMTFVNVGWYVAPTGIGESEDTNTAIDTDTLSLNSIETQVLMVGGTEISMNELGALSIGSSVEINGDLLIAGTVRADKFEVDTQTPAAASAGSARLTAGQSKLIVETKEVTKDSLIFVTPNTLTDKVLSVTLKKEGESFTVETTIPSAKDIQFSWWIVN